MDSCQCKNKYLNDKTNEKKTDARVPTFAHLKSIKDDFLYHIDIQATDRNLEEEFGDIKFVCLGGTKQRMRSFAYYIAKEIGYKLPTGTELKNISKGGGRYHLYKVGPVLSVSHGIGAPSIAILLNELIKLIFYSKCRDPVFLRIGTCGGIGLEPGTVVITEAVVDETFDENYKIAVLGKIREYPAIFDKNLTRQLRSFVGTGHEFKTVSGTTMSANDFYEGQGRLDGAFCDITAEDRMAYMKLLRERGIKNLEMELLAFGAMTHRAGIRAAGVCVTLLDRLNGDQVLAAGEVLQGWQERPQILVARYIKDRLGIKSEVV